MDSRKSSTPYLPDATIWITCSDKEGEGKVTDCCYGERHNFHLNACKVCWKFAANKDHARWRLESVGLTCKADCLNASFVLRLLSLTVVVTCAMPLIGPVGLWCWQPRHSAGTGKRKPEAIRGWVYLTEACQQSMPKQPLITVWLNKWSWKTNLCSVAEHRCEGAYWGVIYWVRTGGTASTRNRPAAVLSPWYFGSPSRSIGLGLASTWSAQP